MMAGWTKRRQALHDMPCDCIVIRVAAGKEFLAATVADGSLRHSRLGSFADSALWRNIEVDVSIHSSGT